MTIVSSIDINKDMPVWWTQQEIDKTRDLIEQMRLIVYRIDVALDNKRDSTNEASDRDTNKAQEV